MCKSLLGRSIGGLRMMGKVRIPGALRIEQQKLKAYCKASFLLFLFILFLFFRDTKESTSKKLFLLHM